MLTSVYNADKNKQMNKTKPYKSNNPKISIYKYGTRIHMCIKHKYTYIYIYIYIY